MEEQNVGIDGLKKCIYLGVKNFILGAKVAKEGVNAEDLQNVPELIQNVQELIAFVKSKPQLGDELKDIDPAEAFALIQECYNAYKEIKEEV